MREADFETLFKSLGLDRAPADLSVHATLGLDSFGQTLVSSPGEQDSSREKLPGLTLGGGQLSHRPDEAELVAVQVLGEGGMGRVLLARQHSLSRKVAVKVLKETTRNPVAARALVDEARVTGSLEHPGVVPVYALGQDDAGDPALVMRRVDGVSWRDLLQDGDHPLWQHVSRNQDRLEAHLEILIAVSNAIAHAHLRGVIHRDIKPANILIGELGETYVADWGIAIERTGQLPTKRQLVGSPAYLAPEMVTGDAALMDERTDVYLLGGTLHEVITGSPPHQAATLREVMQQAFEAAPPQFAPSVPPELAQLCITAMAADPRERFQTAVEFRDALRLYLALRGALRFVETGNSRLRALEALFTSPVGVDSQQWYTLVSECRFAFSQGIDAFALNLDAHRGLKKCLQLAVRQELKSRNLGSARGLMAELKHMKPHPDLVEGLQRLEREEAGRLAMAAKLVELEHESNPSVSALQRNLLMGATVPAIALVAAASYVAEQLGGEGTFGRWSRIAPPVAFLFIFLVGLALGWRPLLATRLNRQLTLVFGINLVAVTLARVFSVLLDVPLRVSLTFEALILSALIGVLAFFWHWTLVFAAALFFLGAVGSTAFPEHAMLFVSGFNALAVLSELVVFRIWRNDVSRATAGR